MNDFLFNVGLVLLATNAAIQFCAQAFALYANQTAIHEIWGDQVCSAPYAFKFDPNFLKHTHGSASLPRFKAVLLPVTYIRNAVLCGSVLHTLMRCCLQKPAQ